MPTIAMNDIEAGDILFNHASDAVVSQAIQKGQKPHDDRTPN